ncbi:MAG: formate/nitrite transporter family protein [Flavobacteriales bacterium]|nr:formate/nitrite transporter family protein [Flavobacteriales bacterium]
MEQPPLFGSDAFSPREIAERVQRVGVTKARLSLAPLAVLGFLAGAFIGFGALFYNIVAADIELGFAATRLLGGLVFCLGLLLVVVAGAELFTGNNLLVMAWADRAITTGELLRNWTVVLLSNFVGAAGLAALVHFSGHAAMADGAVGESYVRIAAAKCDLPFGTAFFSGILCNALVCLAVWMTYAGRTVVDKALAIVFPITAFVAAGFEHSVANMYLIPMGLLLDSGGSVTVQGMFTNLLPVILGNIVGGGGFVALVYHLVYRRGMGVK